MRGPGIEPGSHRFCVLLFLLATMYSADKLTAPEFNEG